MKVSAPVRILSWLGLSETEIDAATELTSSGESLESAKRLQALGDDSAHLPAIASVVTDEQVAACSRQLVTQEGAKYAAAMAVPVTSFRKVSRSSPVMR